MTSSHSVAWPSRKVWFPSVISDPQSALAPWKTWRGCPCCSLHLCDSLLNLFLLGRLQYSCRAGDNWITPFKFLACLPNIVEYSLTANAVQLWSWQLLYRCKLMSASLVPWNIIEGLKLLWCWWLYLLKHIPLVLIENKPYILSLWLMQWHLQLAPTELCNSNLVLTVWSIWTFQTIKQIFPNFSEIMLGLFLVMSCHFAGQSRGQLDPMF